MAIIQPAPLEGEMPAMTNDAYVMLSCPSRDLRTMWTTLNLKAINLSSSFNCSGNHTQVVHHLLRDSACTA